MVGSSAAAATKNTSTALCHKPHLFGKIGGGDVIDGAAVYYRGHTCIGVYDDGERGARGEFWQKIKHFVRAEGAVDTDRIDSEALEHCDHSLGGCAGHKATLGVVDVCDDDGKIGCFTRAEDGGLGFIRIVHRFDKYKIGTKTHSGSDCVTKSGQRILKIEVTEG